MTNDHDISNAVAALEVMAGSEAAPPVVEERAAELGNAALARFLTGNQTATARATRPYEQVAVAHRCIQMKLSAVASMPLMVSTQAEEVVESGDIIDLLDNPFPGKSGEDLIRWTVALMDLTGACYWIADQPINKRPPTSLRPVGSTHCRPKYDEDGDLVGYEYRKPGRRGGRAEIIEAERVIPFTLENFQSERMFDPLATVAASRMAIDQVFGADVANLESLHNGIDPGLAFKFPGKPSPEQIAAFDSMLWDRHGSPYKRNKPLYLFDGLDIADFVKKFTEMEFAKLKQMSIVDVCVSLGVPPAVLGYVGEGSLGHGKETEEAHEIFWNVTVLPIADWIARKVTCHLLPAYQGSSRLWRDYGAVERRSKHTPTYRNAKLRATRLRVRRQVDGRAATERADFFAWFDSSHVGVLVDAQRKRAEKDAVYIEKFLVPPADVIEVYDYPFEIRDHQKTAWRPMGLVPVDEPLAGDDDPAGTPAPEPEDDDTPPPPSDDDTDKSMRLVRLNDSQRAQLWQVWRTSWAPIEKRFRAQVTAHQRELRRFTLRRLEDVMPTGDRSATKIEQRDMVTQILFDLVAADKQLLVRVRPLVRLSYQLGGSQSMAEAAAAEGSDKPGKFAMDTADVVSAMRSREIRIKDTNRTLRRRLAAQIADGIASQESTSQIADRIRKEFNQAASRAKSIAQTEVGGAVEDARQTGRAQANVPSKSWLWSRKETGRPWHQATEVATFANPVPNDQLFTIEQTGARTPHPRGPGLTAEDAVNCACTAISRYPDDQVKDLRVLSHLMTRGFVTPDQLKEAA